MGSLSGRFIKDTSQYTAYTRLLLCVGKMVLTTFLLLMVTLTYVSASPKPVVNFHVVSNLSNNNYSNVNVNFDEVNIYVQKGDDGDYELANNLDGANQIEGSDGSEEESYEEDSEEEEEAEEQEKPIVEGSDGSEELQEEKETEENEEAEEP